MPTSKPEAEAVPLPRIGAAAMGKGFIEGRGSREAERSISQLAEKEEGEQ